MTQTQKQNVPKLRFPGFEAALESVKLEDVATFSKGKGISKSDIDPDGDQFCIRYGELYTVYDTIIDQPISKTSIPASNLKLSKGDEVLVPASGEDAKDIATAAVVKQAGVALGGDLNIIHSKNDGAFLASYLSGRKRMTLAAMAQGNSVVHLYPAQLKTLDLHLPTLPEQRKIASFLGAVDAKITHLSRKKALLEDYKKGCMQQLFSQKIRFKDDDGNDFPDWIETTIGKVGHFYYGKSAPKFSLAPDAPTPCVRYGELYSTYGLQIDNVVSRTTIDPKNLKFSKGGEILVPRVGEDPMDFATCCLLIQSGVAIGEMISVFNTKQDSLFYTYYFRTYKKQFAKMVEGANVSNLYYSYLEDIPIGQPHIAEQRKIADFLSALDRKIDLVAQELTFARSFKAGLLQQMFV